MTAALIPSSFCVLFALAAFAYAKPQLNVVGEGIMSNPVVSNAPGAGKAGMRYAGPIVYTNEKPPIIYFPPPPKDAKPGFSPGGGFSFFGKSKSPKSIKYVPMPHHDLPVLIYTSDKTPPIHVVQPPNNENGLPLSGPSSFGPSKDNFGLLSGSLSSTYKGILPEATSARIVSSSYEIAGTSYGTPMKAPPPSFTGSLDLPFSASSSGNVRKQKQYSTVTFGSNNARPYNGPPGKKPPHIMYSGHPPIHIFNEPDMFVKAPKQIPLTGYHELPPKASFGPPKSSFGPSSPGGFNSFPYRRPQLNPSSYPSVSENLVAAGSQNNPTSIRPQNTKFSSQLSSMSFVDGSSGSSSGGGNRPHGPPTYSISPPHTAYSVGPFSVEYGPPTEPFMSFSEPSGSLSSFYTTMNDEVGGSTGNQDGWMPGPPPSDLMDGGGHVKENEWSSPSPQLAHQPPPSYSNPSSSSIFIPPSQSSHHHHNRPHVPLSPFSGSKIANLLSSFKLKRPKTKYAIAPKSMHKPPIIIYYGKKPPIHVYQKQVSEAYEHTANDPAASSPSVSITLPESPRSLNSHETGNTNNKLEKHISAVDGIDLTYGASQNNEMRVAAPASPSIISSVSSIIPEGKPAIIQAKPVDIFSSSAGTELQPSIYMARNSLNTIYVSDLSGSGQKALKTFIVRRNEDSPNAGQLAISEATVYPPLSRQKQQEAGSSVIISHIATDRISESSVFPISQVQHEQLALAETRPVVVSLPETTQVDLDQLSAAQEEIEEDERNASGSKTTVLIAPLSPSETDEGNLSGDDNEEKPAESRQVQVAIIQSPSSFQSSLSQAEKEVEEAQSMDNSS